MTLLVQTVAADFAPPAGSAWLGGAARSLAGAIYVTTDAPDARAVTANGLLMTAQGVIYVEEAAP